MSTDRPNPYASPATAVGPQGLRRVGIEAVPSEPELGMINVLEPGAKPVRMWRLAFGPDEAWLYLPEEHSAFAISHAEVAEHANIMVWARYVMLALRGLVPNGRAIAFKIEADAVEVFRRWLLIQRTVVLGSVLKKRLRLSFPIGVIVAASAALGSKGDAFALVFGVGLALLALIGPRYPRRDVFAVEAVLWLSLSASFVLSVIQGSKLSILFAFFCAVCARQAFRLFGFYR